ncbi:hypothetical protein LIER_23748 [Lithospermum erythrorhizon]|uniref:Uncharacterized protein n=1 Tax=Lithospermum erythrorhizon TaxID=34254 RepID=A0AAV3R2S3_LITER
MAVDEAVNRSLPDKGGRATPAEPGEALKPLAVVKFKNNPNTIPQAPPCMTQTSAQGPASVQPPPLAHVKTSAQTLAHTRTQPPPTFGLRTSPATKTSAKPQALAPDIAALASDQTLTLTNPTPAIAAQNHPHANIAEHIPASALAPSAQDPAHNLAPAAHNFAPSQTSAQTSAQALAPSQLPAQTSAPTFIRTNPPPALAAQGPRTNPPHKNSTLPQGLAPALNNEAGIHADQPSSKLSTSPNPLPHEKPTPMHKLSYAQAALGLASFCTAEDTLPQPCLDYHNLKPMGIHDGKLSIRFKKGDKQ